MQLPNPFLLCRNVQGYSVKSNKKQGQKCLLCHRRIIRLTIKTLQYLKELKEKESVYGTIIKLYRHLICSCIKILFQKHIFQTMSISVLLLFTDVTIRKEEKQIWTSFEKYAFGKEFLYKNKLDADTILLLSRIQILFLSILLGIVVFLWSSELSGDDKAGIFALAFYCFSPNILAHSGIAGTDLGVAFFIVLSLYLFRKYLKTPSIKNII